MQVEVTVPGTISIEGALAQFNFLQGKILTIIEASSEDRDKVKAMKDLTKSAFRDQMAWIKTCNDGFVGCSTSATTFGPVNSTPEESKS